MVHIKKNERNQILFSLLKDGVICVKREFHGIHEDTGVENLKVWMLTRSLQSKGYLEVTFSWRHLYYTLTANGINFIKETLGIKDAKVQPKTRKARADANDDENEGEENERGERGERRGRRNFGDREGRGDRENRGEGRRNYGDREGRGDRENRGEGRRNYGDREARKEEAPAAGNEGVQAQE